MRLLSCRIENFGGLSGVKVEFRPDFTLIEAPNGSGKTTLAEFIRAMFYGFPRAGKTLEKNRRKKYLPWQGGRYGGSLCFEHGGASYRIERFFGEKPAGDSFALYELESGKRSARYGADIGVELFGLDSDSFERSTYLPQLRPDSDTLTTDAIRSKLSDLVEDTGDVNNFEKAVKALREKRSLFVPYRGSGGLAAKAQSRATLLQERISAISARRPELERRQTELAEMKSALAAKEAERDGVLESMRLASEAAGKASVRASIQRREAELRENAAAEARLLENYPSGLPEARELDALGRCFETAAAMQARLEPSPAYARAKEFAGENARRFASGVPQEAELRRQSENCARIGEIAALLGRPALSEDESARLDALQRRFAVGVPDDALLARCRELERDAQLFGAEGASGKTAKGSAVKGIAVFAAAAALAVAAGLIYRSGHAPLALAFAVLALCAAAAGFALRRREASGETASVGAKAGEAKRELEAALAPYFGENIPENAAGELAVLRGQYLQLKERRDEDAESRRALSDEARELTEQAEAFLARYGAKSGGEGLRAALDALRRDADTYARSVELAAERERELTASEDALRGCEAAVGEFCAKYRIRLELGDGARLREIYGDAALAASLRETILRQESELAELREGDPEPDGAQTADIDALRGEKARLDAEIRSVSAAIAAAEQEVGNIRAELDGLPALTDELELRLSEYREGRKNAEILDLTAEYLERARERLAGAYLGTVKSGFAACLERLGGEAPEDVSLNSDLEVEIDRNGSRRELAYFSTGQADTVTLCLRIALAGALYKDAKPFLILDDPFVNLDDARVQRFLGLLHELSGEYQIIYFTCSESRK